MVRPANLNGKVAKHVLWYFEGTTEYGLWYKRTEGVKFQGFTDADWSGSPSDRKITPGVIFNIGSVVISCYNMKHRFVALSLVEVEYMVAIQVACEAIWMRKILVGLFSHEMELTVIYFNKQSCIKLSNNLIFHDKSKHIDTWYHNLQDNV